jgi:hypothetical protein
VPVCESTSDVGDARPAARIHVGTLSRRSRQMHEQQLGASHSEVRSFKAAPSRHGSRDAAQSRGSMSGSRIGDR